MHMGVGADARGVTCWQDPTDPKKTHMWPPQQCLCKLGLGNTFFEGIFYYFCIDAVFGNMD